MKEKENYKLMNRTAEQLLASFINETELPINNLSTEFSCWWITQSLQVDIETWSFGSQSIIHYLSSFTSFDARIAKAILHPMETTYRTYHLIRD